MRGNLTMRGRCRYRALITALGACVALTALPAPSGGHTLNSSGASALGASSFANTGRVGGASVFSGLESPAAGSFSHTENPRNGIEEVGFHPLLNAGFNTDVWGHVTQDGRLFGYSGTWGTLEGFADPGEACPSQGDNQSNPSRSGVKIVDLTNAANPQLAAKIGSPPGAQNNDVKVARIDIARGFKGDLLTHSLEPCGAEGLLAQVLGSPVTDVPREQTGFQLYDVSNPAQPRRLGKWNNGGLGTHNHYIVPRPDLNQAFVAAVYNEIVTRPRANPPGVAFDVRGVLQLVDVTDPNAPRLASEWEITEGQGLPCEARGTDSGMCYLHDVWASADGKTLYLSYWDAGLILLDVSNPEQPRFIGRGQQQLQSGDPEGWLNEEGNTHAAVPYDLGGRKLAIVGDEDFTGPGPAPHTTVNEAPAGSAVSSGERFRGTEMSDTRRLSEGAVGPSPPLVADDEYGCAWGSAAAIGNGPLGGNWIGVARRGGSCPLFQTKVALAEAAGADGLILVNEDPGSASGLAASAEMPAMMIGRPEGDRLIAAAQATLTNPAALKVTMEMVPPAEPDPWGFMRVVDVTSPNDADWREVSTFKAPHVDDPVTPEDVFSAHNPIVGPDGRVYFAWYTDGVRVLEPDGTGGAFKDSAWFVPRPGDHPDDHDEDPHGAQEANVGFWGSFPVCDPKTNDLLILNSDLNRGMYILRLTGDSCRLRRADIPAPEPAVTSQGRPRANLVAPRLASDVSTDDRFLLRITTAAPNVRHFQIQARNTRERKWRRVSRRLIESQIRFGGYLGANYRFRGRAFDRDGNPGPWDYERTIVPFDELRQLHRPEFRGGWWHPKKRPAWFGRVTRSRKRGARMSFRFRGSRVYLIGRKSRRGGKAVVILNGKRKRVSFYSRRARNRRVVFAARGRRGGKVNTLVVRNLGRRTKRSRGTLVEIDGIGARRP